MLKQNYVKLGLLSIIPLGAILLVCMHFLSFVRAPFNLNKETIIDIMPGENLTHLAYRWHDEGLLNYPRYLLIAAKLSGAAHDIKAGEYQLMPDTTLFHFLGRLKQGDIIQYPFTIIEGWRVEDILAELASHPKLKSTVNEYKADELLSLFKLDEYNSLEGWLFPDTYYYHKGMKDTQLLQKSIRKMKRTLDEEWRKKTAGLPFQSAYKALIVASIIEKETPLDEEKPLVSSVIFNRLTTGMKLQVDPTVIYGLGESFDGDLTKKQLQADSPYNTYVNAGLPPTPIASPGIESIRAAITPKRTDYLFFVAKGDGGHYFSRNLSEHNHAVKKYQLSGGG